MMKTIILSQGKIALVDDRDFEWLSKQKWHFASGYAVRKEKKNNTIYMHRVIMNTPDNMETDHIDGNGLNNQRANLRICDKSNNQRNRKKQRNNSSGYKGVRWHEEGKKYQARITINHKMISLGLFKSPMDAAKAYDQAARKYHGDFANTNF